VVSAIGARGAKGPDRPEMIDYQGVANLAAAAAQAGIRHFVLVSSMGTTQADHPLNKLFGNVMIWKAKGEQALRDSGVPYTIVRPGGLVNEPAGQGRIQLVQGDPPGVFALPARHLLSKGCKRIAMFKDQLLRDPSSRPPIEPMGIDVDPSSQLEFMRVLAEHDMVVKQDDLICVNHGLDALQPGGLAGQSAAIDALVEWLDKRPQIDGILCTYDIVAGLALEALDRLGRRVPEDVAVTGGGSLHAYSWYFAASLTSIDPDLPVVAQRVCDLLKRWRQGETIAPGHQEKVPCKLVVGASTDRK